MPNSALSLALTLANQQLAAAEAGQFDALIAGLDAYEAACAGVIGEPLAAADELSLRSLIAINARIGTYVGAAATDAARQVRRLQGGRALTGAYLTPAAPAPVALTADSRA